MPEKKLFLLDAFALIYRSHFAFIRTPRINSKGMNTPLKNLLNISIDEYKLFSIWFCVWKSI